MQIKGLSETMLIPLWVKAIETKKENPIVKDIKSLEIINKINYDFNKYKKAKLSHVGICVRTVLFDEALKNIKKENSDLVVINLGAGLDTRTERLKKLDYRLWYDLDLKEAISLRKKFFKETNKIKFIPKSMFDYSWMDDIDDKNSHVLIIAEGLFMYFDEYKIKDLFDKLIKRFPKLDILFEMLAPFCVGKEKMHDSIKKMANKNIQFKWGLKYTKEIETWNKKIKLIKEWNYFDYYKSRWGLFGLIARLPFIKPMFASRLVHIKIT